MMIDGSTMGRSPKKQHEIRERLCEPLCGRAFDTSQTRLLREGSSEASFRNVLRESAVPERNPAPLRLACAL